MASTEEGHHIGMAYLSHDGKLVAPSSASVRVEEDSHSERTVTVADATTPIVIEANGVGILAHTKGVMTHTIRQPKAGDHCTILIGTSAVKGTNIRVNTYPYTTDNNSEVKFGSSVSVMTFASGLALNWVITSSQTQSYLRLDLWARSSALWAVDPSGLHTSTGDIGLNALISVASST